MTIKSVTRKTTKQKRTPSIATNDAYYEISFKFKCTTVVLLITC